MPGETIENGGAIDWQKEMAGVEFEYAGTGLETTTNAEEVKGESASPEETTDGRIEDVEKAREMAYAAKPYMDSIVAQKAATQELLAKPEAELAKDFSVDNREDLIAKLDDYNNRVTINSEAQKAAADHAADLAGERYDLRQDGLKNAPEETKDFFNLSEKEQIEALGNPESYEEFNAKLKEYVGKMKEHAESMKEYAERMEGLTEEMDAKKAAAINNIRENLN